MCVCVCVCVFHKEAMQDTKNGTARIIIIVKMLLEGFDHPPV